MDPIDDIHAPTVSSGARTNGVNGTHPTTYAELIAAKENIEAEMKELGSVLDSHGVTMTTGLTTIDGFPRSDIDVAQVRTTRARIIHLRNDYKSIMSKVETAVHEQFARMQADGTANLPSRPAAASSTQGSTTAATRPSIPFAKVNQVTQSSPAALAGLEEGDEIVAFGRVTWEQPDSLRKIAETVRDSEGQTINVTVLRGTSNVILFLIPRRDWGGRGLLGCHLIPL